MQSSSAMLMNSSWFPLSFLFRTPIFPALQPAGGMRPKHSNEEGMYAFHIPIPVPNRMQISSRSAQITKFKCRVKRTNIFPVLHILSRLSEQRLFARLRIIRNHPDWGMG